MSTDNKRSAKKTRSKSIARRLNAALKRRSLVKSLIADLIIAAMFLAGWCLTVEALNGGRITNVTGRDFYTDGSFDILNNLGGVHDDIEAVFSPMNSPVGNTPLDGLYYGFTVYSSGGNGLYCSIDAAFPVSAIICVTLAVMILQLIYAGISSLGGSRLIRKHLRPIDDIAIMAEKYSAEAERHTAEPDKVREVFRDDGEVTADELEYLTYAIDEIDDSCSRIEVHESELSGIEAAVNNMLKRLDEANRKQIRFVDDASHELRTPIAIIQGYANMLDRWGKDDPKIRDEAIAAIKNEAEHMKILIDQLLFLARGEMSRHVMENKPVDCGLLLWELLDESRMLDETHEYVISAPAPADEGDGGLGELTVTGDAAMLRQCLRILRDNAVKYTPAGGQITLKGYVRQDSAKESPKVCLEITDTGIGIPAPELPRIFDRFYRGSNARTDNTSGSGLGLSIAKWIATEHGGKIEAISSTGIGTKMTIVLEAIK